MRNLFIIAISLLLLSLSACGGNTSGNTSEEETTVTDTIAQPDTTTQRIGICMEKSGGVYTLPCYVNGIKMKFIFDTGASNVCISLTEALFLYKNGYLEENDIIGESKSVVADGSIVENMEINLHSIEVEGIMMTDVKAVVVKSLDAPLLLGQSAIQKMGKIELSGDSLFIYRKGPNNSDANIQTTKSEVNKVKYKQVKDATWWDKLCIAFGNDSKIEEYLNAAYQLTKDNFNELAQEYCNKALALDSTNWKSYSMLGYVVFDANPDKNLTLQIENFEKYIELNRNKEDLPISENDTIRYADQLWKLAWAYIDGPRLETRKAISLCQEVLAEYPDNARAYRPMIIGYCDLTEYEKANSWAKKLLEIDKEWGYFYLAYIANLQGRRSECIRFYEKCLELNPQNEFALNNLADQYSGEYEAELKKKAARLGFEYAQKWCKRNGYSW